MDRERVDPERLNRAEGEAFSFRDSTATHALALPKWVGPGGNAAGTHLIIW